MSSFNGKNYNFNSIGDLLEYRKYLLNEIEKYSKFITSFYCSFYIMFCYRALKIVNVLIRKKGYK